MQHVSETKAEETAHFAEWLGQRVKHRFESGELTGTTASCRAADFPSETPTPRALREAADAGMYESKHAGRNRVPLSSRSMFAAGAAAGPCPASAFSLSLEVAAHLVGIDADLGDGGAKLCLRATQDRRPVPDYFLRLVQIDPPAFSLPPERGVAKLRLDARVARERAARPRFGDREQELF